MSFSSMEKLIRDAIVISDEYVFTCSDKLDGNNSILSKVISNLQDDKMISEYNNLLEKTQLKYLSVIDDRKKQLSHQEHLFDEKVEKLRKMTSILEDTCMICQELLFDKIKHITYLGCSHYCCDSCYDSLSAVYHGNTKKISKCPMCRDDIDTAKVLKSCVLLEHQFIATYGKSNIVSYTEEINKLKAEKADIKKEEQLYAELMKLNQIK